MSDEPSLQGYPDLRRYGSTNFGYSTGNPMIDTLVMMYMGNTLASRPLPGSSQSIYDAYQMRERNIDFMKAAQKGFGNNFLFERMGGINTESGGFSLLSMLARDPDGIAAKLISPLVGGNPIRAQMGLFGNLSGQALSTFGTTSNITVPQTTEMMNQLYKSFYHQSDPITPEMVKANKNKTLEKAEALLGSNSEAFKAFEKSPTDFIKEEEVKTRLSDLFKKGASEENKAEGDTLIASLKDSSVKSTIKAIWSEAIETGTKAGMDKAAAAKVAAEKVAEVLNPMAVEPLKELTARVDDDKKMEDGKGTRPISINWANTRGLKLEDFTEGFSAAADFKLLGKRGISENWEKFIKNSPGVIDSAKSLFGQDKASGQLIQEISNLVGNNFFDIADEGSSQKLETLLRDVKAAARTAGVSIEAIKGIINQGKQLAANHPTLSALGGADITQMALRSVHGATAMSAFYGNDYMRRAGGMTGATQTLMQAEIQSVTEPISEGLFALIDTFNTSGDVSSQNLIKDYANSKDPRAHTRIGYNAFLNDLSNKSGMPISMLHSISANNKIAAQRGALSNPELAQVGVSAYVASLKEMVALRAPQAMAEVELYLNGQEFDLNKYLNENENTDAELDITKELGGDPKNFKDFLNKDKTTRDKDNPEASKKFNELTRNLGGKALTDKKLTPYLKPSTRQPDALQSILAPYLNSSPELNNYIKYGLTSGYLQQALLYNNPATRRIIQMQVDRATVGRQVEEKMSKELGYLNAPLLTSIFDQAFNGTVEKEGITGLLAGLSAKEANNRPVVDTAHDLYELRRATEPEELEKFVEEKKLITLNKGSITQLVDSKLTGEQIRRYSRKGKEGSEEIALDGKKGIVVPAQFTGESGKIKLTQMREVLNKLDPTGKMKGIITTDSVRKVISELRIQSFKDAAIKPYIDEENKAFNQDVFNAVAELKDNKNPLYDDKNKILARDIEQGYKAVVNLLPKGPPPSAEDFNTTLTSKKGQQALQEAWVSDAARELLTNLVTPHVANIQSVKSLTTPGVVAVQDQMLKTIQDIAKSIGSGGGINLVEVLSQLLKALQDASKVN